MRSRVAMIVAAVMLIGWIGARRAVAGTLRPPAPSRSAAARLVWVSVRPGDSLWALGRRFAPPGSDLRRWVYRVERLNGLRGAMLTPGERLALPAG